jgi:hypothetical protein
VNRFASEYQKTMANATGASTRQSVLRRDALNRKIVDDTRTKSVASQWLIAPRGISRIAVRGLSASHRASTRRLKPMAALRALTMQTTIQTTCVQENGSVRHASSAPVSANGSANTEWLKRTNEK